jgi:regulator of replication initiation timing
MEYSNLFSYISMLGEELGSLYRNSKSDKRAVVGFMEANGWFGMEHPVMKKKRSYGLPGFVSGQGTAGAMAFGLPKAGC